MATAPNQGSASSALAGFVVLFLMFWIGCYMCGKGGAKGGGASSSSVKTREERLKACFSGWDGAHLALEKWVKANMNDPDSYEHVETRYDDSGGSVVLVSLKFRGANAFGGKVVNTAVANTDADCNIIGTPTILR